MARLIRFILYGLISAFIVIARANTFFITLEILKNKDYFCEDGIFLTINSLLMGGLLIYFVWLLGATIDRWPMPNRLHVFPILLLTLVLMEEGVLFRSSKDFLRHISYPKNEFGSVERSIYAMTNLSNYLSDKTCSQIDENAMYASLGEFKWSGYRSHGIRRPFKITRIISDVDINDSDFKQECRSLNAGVGTICFVCNNNSRSFFLTALVSDKLPQGEPTFILDGVGKIVTISGHSR